MTEFKKLPLMIDNLFIEVTRKCNMQCKHCLRGDSQDIDITNDIINTIIDNVNRIGTIQFTGGEPTLNLKAIRYIFKRLHERDIEFQSFWIATNGKKYSQNLINTLIEEYSYCMETQGYFSGGLALSFDKYHEKINEKTIHKYKALKFYDESKEKTEELINEGRAYENGLIARNLNLEDKFGVEIEEEITVEQVYINALGDILVGCDYSYDSQEDHKLGNILKNPLKDIILENR